MLSFYGLQQVWPFWSQASEITRLFSPHNSLYFCSISTKHRLIWQIQNSFESATFAILTLNLNSSKSFFSASAWQNDWQTLLVVDLLLCVWKRMDNCDGWRRFLRALVLPRISNLNGQHLAWCGLSILVSSLHRVMVLGLFLVFVVDCL